MSDLWPSTFPGIVSKWFSFPLCRPPPLPISFSFSLFLSSPLFPFLHRGKIRVNTGQDTPVSVSILTECKMGRGGGGREGGRKAIENSIIGILWKLWRNKLNFIVTHPNSSKFKVRSWLRMKLKRTVSVKSNIYKSLPEIILVLLSVQTIMNLI